GKRAPRPSPEPAFVGCERLAARPLGEPQPRLLRERVATAAYSVPAVLAERVRSGLLDRQRRAVHPQLDRERLLLDPLAVVGHEIRLRSGQRDDDPVGELETRLLTATVDLADQVA